MNKKFTSLAVALMVAGTLSAETISIPKLETTEDYCYLKMKNLALSLHGSKADSVIMKAVDEENLTKAQLDSALWQIVDKQIVNGVATYQIRNKATNAYLAFAPKDEPTPVLDFSAKGINRWQMDGNKLKGYYPGTTDYLVIGVGNDGQFAMKKGGVGTEVSFETPKINFPLNAESLGNGFTVFQLVFGDKYEGNIFEGKELIAKDVDADKGYVTLQIKGDEVFSDGKSKLLGVDTTKVTITNANDVFGANFKADSTYKALAGVHTVGNANFQQFKFTIDLKNDSIAMYVKAAPNVNGESLSEVVGDVRVVYAQTGNKKVLTVSRVGTDGTIEQGALPLITSRQGTPTTLPDGDGVYYLKSASKDVEGGKYYVAYKDNEGVFFGGDSVPVLTRPRGQWIVKENNGKYTIVDRESNTALIQNKQIFEVPGMESAYLIGQDTISVKQVGVDLKDKFIGSFAPTEQELVDKGYYMSLFTSTPGVPDLFMYTNDSILKGSAVDMNLFKLYPVDTTVVAGAKLLGDEISEITYEVGGYFVDGKIAKDEEKEFLKFSTSAAALRFRFRIHPAGLMQYAMMTEDGKYVGIDINSSNLQLTDQWTNVNLAPEDAPEYASFEAGHKRISVDGNSLVMNPLNRFAQMKAEGSEITKAVYEKDNFSLWVEPDTVVAGKQLYFISSVVDGTRYYLSFKDTTVNGISAEAYKNAMFLPDTVKTVKDSPALFAFKVNEHGGYILENQQQLKGGYPYVGIVGNSVVLERFASVAFEVQTASAPTANEEMNVSEIKVISNDGQVIVTNASGKMITLSNILGQTIGVRRANSEYFSMPATSGIVLVTVEGDTTYKVIVK
ncbi:MAG TPA: DUF6383 domain-containing protein [Parabacteroides johnsonii]|jgi:hypothetical protein|uniref:DUF6383 domain-containing protein n=4 Tax=Parabacteroides johnsonii TaxID=387661 RepID=A0A9Q5X854_9BACT|nr:DUF6383 domain-containing protein [Parabacteroides johnsonii]CCX78134.1 putative uncharacterized protein [Parabacteroides johnsonii CAG:246]OUO04931.1 hypothetical protein B5F96_11105 [Parabacteroides johnsonii]UEA89574.1 DUF6383 domain-containing protein [Parabacteroides johnsonii]UWP41737.1 DUF6383 domain-containing protein [Parabacteroides johnsonii DSM 18315]HJH00297.1 DUF6383 domain-containing protein [Parabacteroides johnsonii]